MKHEIIPAILVHSAEEAQERLTQIKKAPWVQWDVMDQTLVPNQSWYEAATIKQWKSLPNIEMHLMVQDPEAVIRAWRGVKNLKRVIWHIEAPVNHEKMITFAKRLKLEVGLALSPETPVAALVPYLRKIDAALILGVHPGWSGQKLIPGTIKKVAALRKLIPRLPISFDGSITKKNILTLKTAGVTRFTIASAIFDRPDPAAALQQLQATVRGRA